MERSESLSNGDWIHYYDECEIVDDIFRNDKEVVIMLFEYVINYRGSDVIFAHNMVENETHQMFFEWWYERQKQFVSFLVTSARICHSFAGKGDE